MNNQVKYTGETCGEPQYTKDQILAWPGRKVYHPKNANYHDDLEVIQLSNSTDLGVEILLPGANAPQERHISECYFSFDEMYSDYNCGICNQFGDHHCPR